MQKELSSLAIQLRNLSCFSEARLILKLAEDKLYLYSFVPTENLDLILEYGLASSNYIRNNLELLEKIFPQEADRQEWLDRFKNEEDDLTLQGPSVFLTKPNLQKILELNPKHPLSEGKFTLIKIDYSKLLEHQPDLKLEGLELVPYQDEEYEERKKEIEHTLSKEDVKEFNSQSFEENWEHYLPMDGFFAANVPHAVVINKEGVIPPEYLQVEK